jgi:hypothetical protein
MGFIGLKEVDLTLSWHVESTLRRTAHLSMRNYCSLVSHSAVLDHDTRGVKGEVVIAVEFGHDWPISEHFLLDHLGCWHEVVAIDIIALIDFSSSRAVFVVRALVALRAGSVWSARFCDQVACLGEEAVEDAPSAFAAFVQVVALHHELRGEAGNLCSSVRELELEASVDGLNEALSVAGAALELVPDRPGEVVASNISEVPLTWHHRVWNLVTA